MISIAMATYNGARFIEEQLQSFAEQIRLPDELVITDDGSTDDTIAIAERFASGAPFPVRVHSNCRRLGFSRNFEAAIARCAGDIIFLSDQDDVWFPDKLETVAAQFEANDRIEVVMNGQIVTDARLKHRGVTMVDNLRRLGKTSDSLVEGCTTSFRRRWGELLFPMPAEAEPLINAKRLSHDLWLNRLSLLLGVRAFIERPLQFFRRHDSNVTQWLGNRPERIRFTDLVATRVDRPPTDAWEQRLAVLDLYDRWLIEHRSKVAGTTSVSTALAEIDRERRSLKTRSALVHRPILTRAPAAAKLWLSGGYTYFNGWKSAVRDITRKASSAGARSAQ